MKLPVILICMILVLPKGFSQGFNVRSSDEGIEIREGENPVFHYQKSIKSKEGLYERTGYVHPLYSLDGKVITEDFPDDHPHHHGIFWGWHQVIHQGEKVGDSWTSENISWAVEKVSVKKSKKRAGLRSTVVWSANPHSKPFPIIRERTRITVHKKNSEYRIVDIDIQLIPLVENLQLGGSEDAKGYGGFSLRLRDPEDLEFVSQGNRIKPAVTAVTAGSWMDFRWVDGTRDSGVTVFCHPDNPGSNNDWILRNDKSMQNAVWPGASAIELPSKGISLNYRLVIHTGKLSQRTLESMYREYQ